MSQPDLEYATLAGGCFWCLEAVFLRVKGVVDVASGYSNGHVAHPTYEAVCTGQTGHAEVVRIAFDPAVVSYTQLLEVFFRSHDPTTLNRQGNDVGTQYRSAIFTHDEAQAQAAMACLQALKATGAYGQATLVTEVQAAQTFYPAEPEHHRYFERNPYAGYCAFVVAPKVEAFVRAFPHLRVEADRP